MSRQFLNDFCGPSQVSAPHREIEELEESAAAQQLASDGDQDECLFDMVMAKAEL